MGAQEGRFDGPNATSDVLAGSAWAIEDIGGLPVVSERGATLEFGHDGRVSGSTGVNEYTASYLVVGDIVTFGPLATTRRAGTSESLDQEHRVVVSIAGHCPFRFEGSRLVLDGSLGTVRCWSLDARPAPEAVDPPPDDIVGD